MSSSVVVTGGARGIGRGIAERFVARGFHVVLTDIDGAAAADTATEIGADEGLTHDVRNPADHAAAAEAALHHGPLAAWFNNAGVGDDGRLAELSDEQVRRLVEVNLLGVLWGMRTAFSSFGPDGGDVVNVASLAGLGPVPGYTVYAATKAAVVSATASAQAETPRAVRVHALCPDGVHLVPRLGSLEQLAIAASVPVAVLPDETRTLDGDAALDLAIAITGARA